jgi:uncharacterized membrane protein YkvA (DUF1232 family)
VKISKALLFKVRSLKTEVYTLFLAYRDPRTPWYARAFMFLIIAYALSPVDIIPDFVPVLGYVDDLIILPLGIYLAVKLIPEEVREECRRKAKTDLKDLRMRWMGLALVVLAWLLLAVLVVLLIIRPWK